MPSWYGRPGERRPPRSTLAGVREVIGALIGVPATACIAGGLVLAAVTAYTHLRRRPGREPIRWAHLGLGALLFLGGTLLIWIELLVAGR